MGNKLGPNIRTQSKVSNCIIYCIAIFRKKDESLNKIK